MPEVLRELGIIFSPRHNFDVQSFRDPLPGAIDLQRIILSYARRLSALFGERKFKRVQQQRWSKGEVERAVARADSMLFLCYGNINRSALADVMIRAYAEDAGVGVTSCGFHPEEGRRADPVMSEVAADNGLDMTKLSSTLVTADMVAGSDIIFVMEKSHYDRLSHMCPDAVDRIYLLGAHQNDSGWPAEIEDPYGGARAGYTACFQRIEAAVHCIKAMIATRSID
jgi:protein-tyrosine-phosphatase